MLWGRWREADRTIDEVIADREAEGVPYYLDPACYALRASIELARGHLQAASRDSAMAVERAQWTKDPQILAPALVVRGMVLLAQGRRDDASATASAALEPAPVLVVALHGLVPVATVIDFAWLLGNLGRESDLVPALAAAPTVPWVQAARAIVAGDAREGLEHVARIGAPSILADTRRHAAKELSAAGHSAEAVSHLEKALDFYRPVGATRYAGEAEALAAAIAARRSSASPT